jgi:prolyl-tRNA synthetase
MFADMELTGIPHRVTIGDRGLKNGELEYQHRRDTKSQPIPAVEAVAWLLARLA